MAWWLQGDLQPFAHFRSGMGRSLAAPQEPPQRPQPSPAAGAAGLRPVLTLCRDWVRGREQSEANEKRAACERATRR